MWLHSRVDAKTPMHWPCGSVQPSSLVMMIPSMCSKSICVCSCGRRWYFRPAGLMHNGSTMSCASLSDCLYLSTYLPIYLSLSLCIRPINWFSIINVAPQVVFTSIFAIILSISLQKIIGTLITIGTWTFHVTQLILYSAKTKSKIIIIYHSDSKILLLIYHYNIYYECA